jgi:TP901 family phage tail tape measure protein
MAEEFRVSLVAELKQKSLDSAIRNAKSDVPLKISKFTINATNLAKQLQAELNKANLKVKIDGNFGKSGSTVKQINEISKAYQELMRLQKSMGSTKVKLAGLDAQKDAKQIAELRKQLDALSKQYEALYKGNVSKLNATQLSALVKAQQDAKAKLDAATAKAADKQAQAQVKAAEKHAQAQAKAAKQSEAEWAKAAQNMKKEWIAAQKALEKQSKKTAQEQLTLTKSDTLSNKIQVWMAQNAKAAAAFDSELKVILSNLSGNKDPAVLQKAAAEFAKLQSQAKATGLVTNSFAASIKNVGLQVLGLGSAYQVVMKIINAVKQGVNTVVALDTALVDLRKTSTMSGSDLANFYRDANEEAKNLGVTTEEIIAQAAQWSRLGYGSKHDATLMARLSSQFAAISPGMSVTEATDSLVSTMKAFGIETDQVLDGVMSKINILGNSFALSNKDLADALQVSSASMKAANNSFEQTLALITAGTEITQDASRVGNGLRTISMRIRALDEETGEYDETLGNIKNDISELTHGKVSIMEDEDTYRSTYDILKRISEIWGELTDKEQAGLLEKLFGKNRAQIGMAILSNFSAAEEAMAKMENSAGNADKEMSIIMDSLEYKLNALKETGTGIWQNLFPREMLGNIINGLTSLAGALEAITGFLGPGGTLLAAGGLTAFFANFGRPFEGTLNSEIFKPAYYGQEHAVMVA